MKNGLLTLDAAAKVLGIHKNAVRYHIKTNGLPAERVPNGWRIKETDLHTWMGTWAGLRAAKRQPKSPLERDFKLHLEKRLGPNSVTNYMAIVRRFLRYIGNQRIDRIGEDIVRAFFNEFSGRSKSTQQLNAMVIGEFLRFAAEHGLPATIERGSKVSPVPTTKDKKELALHLTWAADKLAEQKEAGDDLVAKLARKVIDHYLYFQSRIKGEPENLDDVYRLADECKELIEANLPLFMELSAGGRNIHSRIDERVQR